MLSLLSLTNAFKEEKHTADIVLLKTPSDTAAVSHTIYKYDD